MPQGSKITLMPTGVREEKPSIVRSQLQQNIRPSRPIIQTMQHTPQQINEIIQSQIQQQQMQEKAKQRAAAASTPNTTSQSPIMSMSHEVVSQSQSITQISAQKVPAPQQTGQQIITTNTQVSMSTNQGNSQQQVAPNQMNPNQLPQGNQITMQRQISLQQIEANARNQKIQMISQQLQQSTQNQQQLLAQQQFKQFQSNQMMNTSAQPTTQGNVPIQNVQQQFVQGSQPGNVQQGQTVTVQHPQQFTGQQMKQVINPNQQSQQQFIMNQNVPSGTVKSIGQQPQGNNNGGNNYIQIIQQGQQIIQIQHPEGGQVQQKVLNQHVC